MPILSRAPHQNFSAAVSASLVKELRARSGAPMMDCKKALCEESVNGDIEKAIDFLRVKGLAKSSANVCKDITLV